MDGYKLLRRGSGMVLCIRECFDAVGNDKVKSIWIRIRGMANKADILMGVSCRPPNQDEETDEAFWKQLVGVAQSPALVLMGDFNLPDTCCKYNTALRK